MRSQPTGRTITMRDVDFHTRVSARQVLAPQDSTSNTPMVGNIINRVGFDGLELMINIGSISAAGASFAVLIEDGNTPTLTDNATVASTCLLGTLASFAQ